MARTDREGLREDLKNGEPGPERKGPLKVRRTGYTGSCSRKRLRPLLISRLNGDIIEANPAFYKLLDYPVDGSVGLNFVRDNLYEKPEVRPVIHQKLFEDGVLDTLELNLLDRHGNPVPVLVSYALIDIQR